MKPRKTITKAELMAFDPCDSYLPLIKKWFSVKNRLGLQDLKNIPLDELPAQDRLWLLLRPFFIRENDLHELACKFAERALRRERKAGREPDKRSWEAIRVKRRWLAGKATDDELTAARDAALEAAWAARSASWEAAVDARNAAGAAGAARAAWAAVAAWAARNAAREAGAARAAVDARNAAGAARAAWAALDAWAARAALDAWDDAGAAEVAWQLKQTLKVIESY